MRKTRRRTQVIEQLEVRQLMSAQPIGNPIQVNSRTDGATAPFTASVPGGGFVTVFRDNLLDGDGGGIYARRYSSTGVALGTPSRVNNVTAGDQSEPTVTVDKSGKLTYAWMSFIGPGSTNPGFSVHNRRYNPDGTAIGNSKQVLGGEPPTTDGEVIYGGSDDFIHAFTDSSNNTILIAMTNYEERFRVVKLSPSGTVLSAFTINLLTGYNSPSQQSNLWRPSHSPLIHFDASPSGEIIVGYELTRNRLVVDVGNRSDYKGVVRRYSPQGTQLNDITIYSTTINPEVSFYPTFAVQGKVNPDGTLSVLYTDPSRKVFLRKYTRNGTAIGSATKVTTNALQGFNLVTYDFDILPNGNNVVAWTNPVPFRKDQSFIQEFSKSLKPLGDSSEFDGKSPYIGSWQVTAVSNTRALVTWVRIESAPDTGANNCMVQRFHVGNDVVSVISSIGSTTVPDRAEATESKSLKSATLSDIDDTNMSGHTLRVETITGVSSTNRTAFLQVTPGSSARGFYIRESGIGGRTLWYAEQNSDAEDIFDF